MNTENEVVLCGKELNKKFVSNGRETVALSNVSFDLHRGEILGIVGESGSGKSTLLRVIAGMEKPDGGKLFHNEEMYNGWPLAKIGKFMQLVFQDAYGSFDPKVKMKASLMEIPGVKESDILSILEKTGLDEITLERVPKRLSGGQCQRMSIARALLTKVKIILCDEITSALDVTTQAQVVELLLELRKSEDISILFVSHDLALVSMLCDRVMVLKDGVCVEEGVTREVITNPQHSYTKQLLSNVITVNK